MVQDVALRTVEESVSRRASTDHVFEPPPLSRHWVQHGFRGLVNRRPDIRMVPDSIRVDGRRVQFAVSDNVDAHGPAGPGSPPVWAVNLHGYFAGGAMYWRESARLAERLGWRMVNPSLPGFGGSDPLQWDENSLSKVAHHLEQVLRHIGAGPVVLIGHSMGGAVAVRHAVDHPRQVLGILYRDGIATPAWRQRHGLAARVLAPVLPDLADHADLLAAVLVDIPDLLVGRFSSTIRSLLPDVRRNLTSASQSFPLASMLMSIDLRPELRRLAEADLPILPEWGCWDHVVNEATAEEFARCTRQPVLWVPGGHSWMLARPQGQADILCYVPAGTHFRRAIEERWYAVSGWRPPVDHGEPELAHAGRRATATGRPLHSAV
jgi:pimeloyl-ACP methyl ester carboxylesterase